MKFSLRYAGLEIFDGVVRGDWCVLAVMMLTCRRKAWPVDVTVHRLYRESRVSRNSSGIHMTIAGPTHSAVLESSRRGIDKDGRDDRL